MEKIKKLFGKYEFTWQKVILFAVISAVVTAGLKLIPFLDNTSFQDIAVNLDMWFLFAIFIIVNCNTWWEASLKCFVFFLISQPLIYLIQVPFVSDGFGIFRYYPRWFIFTLLTLPGSAVAFLVKKKNWLSALVLSVATGYLGYMVPYYMYSVTLHFPYHLLSAIICLVMGVMLTLALFEEKKHIFFTLCIMAVCIIVSAVVFFVIPQNNNKESITFEQACISYEVTGDEDIVGIQTDGNTVTVTPIKDGNAEVVFHFSDGSDVIYFISVTNKQVFCNPA